MSETYRGILGCTRGTNRVSAGLVGAGSAMYMERFLVRPLPLTGAGRCGRSARQLPYQNGIPKNTRQPQVLVIAHLESFAVRPSPLSDHGQLSS